MTKQTDYEFLQKDLSEDLQEDVQKDVQEYLEEDFGDDFKEDLNEGLKGAGKPHRRGKSRKTLRMALLAVGAVALIILVVYLAGLVYLWATNAAGGKQPVWAGDESVQEADGDTLLYTQSQLEEAIKAAEDRAAEAGEERVLEQLKAGLTESEKSTVGVLRPLYKDDLIVVIDGEYYFVPIKEGLKKNDYNTENLQILEDGEIQYLEDGEVRSHKGIDVSKFQGEIDWEKVAADGVEFAFIRVGNRGYGAEGRMVEDNAFEQNIKGAHQAGIKVGVYFYTQALNEEELLEEAHFVLEKIAPYKIDCPVVYDVEKTSAASGRMNALSVEDRTRLTKLFCDTIAEAGYRPMIYFNLEMAALMLDIEQLEDYEKWFAYYNPELYFPYDYKVWQYTSAGRVDGIQGEVDLNICFGPIWE